MDHMCIAYTGAEMQYIVLATLYDVRSYQMADISVDVIYTVDMTMNTLCLYQC